MKILITCQYGFSPILNKELKKLNITSFDHFQTGLYVDGDLNTVYEINLQSRIANKVYLQVQEGQTKDWDQLFDMVGEVERTKYISPGHNISIDANIKSSALTSIRTIQSIANKAIFKKLSGENTWKLENDKPNIEVMIWIQNDHAKIFLNTSGDGLYKRGYRTGVGEAPIKENLAAGLVLMSNRDFRETLIDPCCGSGTILIEAAMIARNIAPGLTRDFSFQYFPIFDKVMYGNIKQDAKDKIFNSKQYKIYGYDIDQDVLNKAQENAKLAGVDNDIVFANKSIYDQFLLNNNPESQTTIISNPAYGKRLEAGKEIYQSFAKIFKHTNIKGGIITSNRTFSTIANEDDFKQIKLYNGADECIFWIKKHLNKTFK